MRIFLIGFMCAGKSRVGKALAQHLGLPFVDIDRLIEEREGPLLPLIRDRGEAHFRELESTTLLELAEGPDRVIATGGGTAIEEANRRLMKQSGITVWLDVPFAGLLARIERSGGDRPLLFGSKGDALRERVETLLAEREPLYATADVIIQADAAPVVVVQRIALGLRAVQSK